MEIFRDNGSTITLTIPLIDSNNRPFYNYTPTLTTGDFKVSKMSGGAWSTSNLSTLPSSIGNTGLIFVTISSSEATISDTSYPLLFLAHDTTTAAPEWDDNTGLIWLKNPAVNINRWFNQTVSLDSGSYPVVSTLGVASSATLASIGNTIGLIATTLSLDYAADQAMSVTIGTIDIRTAAMSTTLGTINSREVLMATTLSAVDAKVATISTNLAAQSVTIGTIDTRTAAMANTLSLDYSADQAMSVTIGTIDARTSVMSTTLGSVYSLEQSMATTLSLDYAADQVMSVTIGAIDARTLAMSTTMSGLATTGASMMVTPAAVLSISDGVWDELLTGSNHNIPTSAGRRLRSVGQYSILESTLPSQSTIAMNAVLLDSQASTVSGSYDPAMIVLTGGTGMGQTRMIYQYKDMVAYLDRDWKIKPDNTTEYQILADPGREEVNEGVLRSATAYSVTLNANASTITGNYVQQVLFLRSGPGQDQARIITGYDGPTQVATVADPFDMVPVADETCYVILPTHLYELPQFRTEMDTSLVSYSTSGVASQATLVNTSNTVSLISRDFVEVWVDANNGLNTNTGYDLANALKSYSVATSYFSGGKKGTIYLTGSLDENVTVPDMVSLVGINTPSAAFINGTFVNSITPVVTLGRESSIKGLRVGCYYAGAINTIVKMGDASKIEDCASMFMNGTPTSFIDLGSTNRPGTTIRRNWFSGSGTVPSAIVGTGNNNTSIIEDNEFNNFAGNVISLGLGCGYLKIRNNSFENVATGSSAIYIPSGSGFTVVENMISGAGSIVTETTNNTPSAANIIVNNGTFSIDLTQQDIRNAMALSATIAATPGSIDQKLNSITITVDDIQAMVSDGSSELFKRYYVYKDASAPGDAKSWASATVTIQAAMNLFNTLSGERGEVYVMAATTAYGEQVTIPDGVKLVGVFMNSFPEIVGTGADTTTMFMGNDTEITRVRIGSQGASTLSPVLVAGNGSRIIDNTFGEIGDTAKSVIDLGTSAQCHVEGNWISGSHNALIGIDTNGSNNSVIKNNTFFELDNWHVFSNNAGWIDIENNSFLGVQPGYAAVVASKDGGYNIIFNSYKLAGGRFYLETISGGSNDPNVVQNNGPIGAGYQPFIA